MSFTNDTKPNLTTPATWETIVTTWADEARTWATAILNYFFNSTKPSNSYSNDIKPANIFTNDNKPS